MAVPHLSTVDFRAHLDPAMQRRLERLGLADKPGEWAERYLLCEKLVDPSRPGRLFALRYTMEQSNETSHGERRGRHSAAPR
jgi:hypothetical protein